MAGAGGETKQRGAAVVLRSHWDALIFLVNHEEGWPAAGEGGAESQREGARNREWLPGGPPESATQRCEGKQPALWGSSPATPASWVQGPAGGEPAGAGGGSAVPGATGRARGGRNRPGRPSPGEGTGRARQAEAPWGPGTLSSGTARGLG